MLNRRQFLRQSSLLIGGTMFAGCSAVEAVQGRSAQKPNILFIFADDFAFNALHATGNREVKTPNLDRLVKKGVTFTHAYNQGAWNGAVCVASRCMLNTGRFLWNAEPFDRDKTVEQERQAGRFWSEYMRKAGYETYFTGKWHVQADAEKAFDHVSHVRPGMPKDTPEGYLRPVEGQKDRWSPSDPKFGGFWEGGKHWSEVVGDDAEKFLARAGKSDDPFFMYLAFNAPHDPRQSPRKYVDMYPLNKISVPESYVPLYPYKDLIGCGTDLRDERLAPFPRTEYAVKVNRQEYYAIISHMDAQIARILDALEKSGKADNTYIFFTADHGLAVGHHGLIGKQNMFDHSVRVPMIINGPGVTAGSKIDTPVYLQDVMATSLDLARVEKPGHVQFKSLMPVIEGKRESNYEAVYGGYLDVQRMVTKGRYKMIMYPNYKQILLYDIQEDPEELSDLADIPKYKPVIEDLFNTFTQLQKETGDTLDISELMETTRKIRGAYTLEKYN